MESGESEVRHAACRRVKAVLSTSLFSGATALRGAAAPYHLSQGKATGADSLQTAAALSHMVPGSPAGRESRAPHLTCHRCGCACVCRAGRVRIRLCHLQPIRFDGTVFDQNVFAHAMESGLMIYVPIVLYYLTWRYIFLKIQ